KESRIEAAMVPSGSAANVLGSRLECLIATVAKASPEVASCWRRDRRAAMVANSAATKVALADSNSAASKMSARITAAAPSHGPEWPKAELAPMRCDARQPLLRRTATPQRLRFRRPAEYVRACSAESRRGSHMSPGPGAWQTPSLRTPGPRAPTLAAGPAHG